MKASVKLKSRSVCITQNPRRILVMSSRKRLSRSQKGNIAEFAPALGIFFLIILFPLINLVGIGCGATVVALLSREAASAAGTSTTYQQALTEVKAVSDKMVSSGLGKFGKLSPVGGYLGCGTDLFIVKTAIATNQTQTFGPNAPIAGTVDPDAQLFSYSTVSVYNVGPFLPLGNLPFIGNVPGIGQPIPLKFITERSVEHLDGIGATSAPGSGDGGITTVPVSGPVGPTRPTDATGPMVPASPTSQ